LNKGPPSGAIDSKKKKKKKKKEFSPGVGGGLLLEEAFGDEVATSSLLDFV
jgi:hypothetical protein